MVAQENSIPRKFLHRKIPQQRNWLQKLLKIFFQTISQISQYFPKFPNISNFPSKIFRITSLTHTPHNLTNLPKITKITKFYTLPKLTNITKGKIANPAPCLLSSQPVLRNLTKRQFVTRVVKHLLRGTV